MRHCAWATCDSLQCAGSGLAHCRVSHFAQEKKFQLITALCFKFNILQINWNSSFSQFLRSTFHFLFKLILFWPKISTMFFAPSVYLSRTIWYWFKNMWDVSHTFWLSAQKTTNRFLTSVFGSGIKTMPNPINRTAKGNFSGTRSCSLPLLWLFYFYFWTNCFEVRRP